MTAPERFVKRKALNLPRLPQDTPPLTLASPLDEQPKVDALAAAIDRILDTRFTDRFSERMHESKMVLLRTVAVPFGLGHLVSAYDRVGGDVHTINNVRAGIYATEEKAQEYANRGDYKLVREACHDTESYNAAFDQAKTTRLNGQLEDAYTGQILSTEKCGGHIDHTVSSKTVFNDRARVLAGLDTAELSTIPENLNPTHPSINSSKQDNITEVFIARLERNAGIRKARIAELETKQNLTEGESKELKSRKALDSVDPRKLREKHAHAQDAIDSKINRAWYTSIEFAGEVIGSCAKSATTTGVMAAFGEFLVEFLAACYDEARDWYIHGAGGEPIFDDLKARLMRVADRVMSRKEAAWEAFNAGSLAGFISALISAIINSFRTTQKRVQKMLREGAQSLVRVLTMIARPSEGMSARESLYAATHLVVSSGIVLGGIALEELLEDAIKAKLPVLAFAAEPISIVLSGVVAGLSVVLTASLLDRWDPYGVVEEQDLKHAIHELSSEVEAVWGFAPVHIPEET